MSERAKWDGRYGADDEPLGDRAAAAFLARSLPLLPPPGRCLDLGGGQGRNAAFLVRRGWRVTLVDFALAGVARARALLRADGLSLAAAVADLEAGGLAVAAASFDLVLMINYHDRRAAAQAHAWLRPGGALLVQGFAREHPGSGRGGPRDPARLWGPNELLALAAPLRVVWYEDRLTADDDNPRHPGPKWVVRLVARRAA